MLFSVYRQTLDELGRRKGRGHIRILELNKGKLVYETCIRIDETVKIPRACFGSFEPGEIVRVTIERLNVSKKRV